MTKQNTSNAEQATRQAFETRLVRLNAISVPNDYPRQADPDWVDVLAASMLELGQQQSIRVVEHEDGRLELNFGLVRLEAARTLGWETIRADVIPAADLENGRRRVSTLVENLVRNQFNALEHALALSELKDIHERLYPETRQGGDQKKNQALREQKDILSFWWDASERTGLHPKAIQRSIAIAKGLTEANIARLRGSWLAENQAQLQALAALPFAQQDAVLTLLLADAPEATNVSDALELLRNGRLPKPEDKTYTKTLDSLTRMKPKAREQIFEAFEPEIIAWAKSRLEAAGK